MQAKGRFVFATILTLVLSSASVALAQDEMSGEETNNLPGMVYWHGIGKQAITTESGLQY